MQYFDHFTSSPFCEVWLYTYIFIYTYAHIHIFILKEILYICSDYRACIYFMTPSINFENYKRTKKEVVKDVVLKFRCNINTLNQIISHIYVGYKNPSFRECMI